MKKLLDCPFCAGTPSYSEAVPSGFAVKCLSERCADRDVIAYGRTRASAARNWNARPALAALPGEPVAWGAWSGFEHRVIATATDKMKADAYDGQGDIDIVPLYLAPPAPADKAEIKRLLERSPEWQPITTCPYREAVDLWCVYGGEEYAQYEGGASIGRMVSDRYRTQEYGFFGNQSNDGVPRAGEADLVPVAWRPAVPQCPAKLIAEVLGLPLTVEDARAALKGGDA